MTPVTKFSKVVVTGNFPCHGEKKNTGIVHLGCTANINSVSVKTVSFPEIFLILEMKSFVNFSDLNQIFKLEIQFLNP